MHFTKKQPPQFHGPSGDGRTAAPVDPQMSRQTRGALLGLIILYAVALGLSFWLVSQTAIILTTAMAALLLWSTAAVAVHYLYALVGDAGTIAPSVAQPRGRIGRMIVTSRRHFVTRFAVLWQWILLLGAMVPAGMYLAPYFRFPPELGQSPAATLRFVAVTFLSLGAVLYLFGNYLRALQRRLESPVLAPMLTLLSMNFLASLATGGALLFYLSTGWDVCWLGWTVLGVTALLVLEPGLRLLGRFYQPRLLRKTPPAAGSSVALDFVLGSGQGAKGVVRNLEELVGIKVGEVWIFQFVKESIETVLVVGIVVGWITTCVSIVPMGNRGVLSTLGRYSRHTLGPGLHVSLPWPLGQIHVIATKQVREISLGFDKDLSKPLLWTEKHVEGEKNLLIGGGESLLTINVPIQYRVSDPVAYLTNTTDAEAALRHLAERKLIYIATLRESFHMMTDDREAIAASLQQGIQSEINRLGLGLEITFVGLKDIHPPVEVASAYENVVSAQERKDALIDTARADQARTLPLAYAEANTLKMAAGAIYNQRVNAATGEANRFHLTVAAARLNPDLFRTRLKYNAFDEVLPASAKTIVGVDHGAEPEIFLDLRANDNLSRQARDIPRP